MDEQDNKPRDGTWAAAKPHTVLLVEDEHIVRLVLEEMLQRLGYRVFSVGDGESALELFHVHAQEIDLVVFDMSMPGMSGDTLFAMLKAVAPGLKTLLTTGYSDNEPIEEMRSRGLDGFLPKPFTLQQVRDTLSGVFSD
jgi:CheY-like chemotaxis protein